ncbi:hypothetical protein E8E11_000654 [Didymella keratinophila]|nr:hypothetical protein E8E11_000654 [Didymella keratinophila]
MSARRPPSQVRMFSTHESRPAGGHASIGRAVPGHRVINANVIDLTTDEGFDPTTSHEPKVEYLDRIRTDLHKLSGTEQEALDAKVQRFFDNLYFRTKLVRNGAAILTSSSASVTPTVQR